MPTRIIREGILTSAKVNRLSFMAELFYRRLMTVADDYGRYHASPVTLRGACFPTCPERVTEKQIQGWISECLSRDIQLLSIYESSGCRYLQITNFGQQTRGKSKFPEPSDDSQLLSGCLADDNQMLNLVGVGVVCEGVEVKNKPAVKTASRIPVSELPPEWQEWSAKDCQWSADHAERAFQKFADHWTSKAGKDATKLDWFATWRNWCRNERPTFGVSASGNGTPHKSTFSESVERGMQERMKVGLLPL